MICLEHSAVRNHIMGMPTNVYLLFRSPDLQTRSEGPSPPRFSNWRNEGSLADPRSVESEINSSNIPPAIITFGIGSGSGSSLVSIQT